MIQGIFRCGLTDAGTLGEASQLNVMDLQILGNSATLASPAIALEYLLTKPLIGIRVQAQPGLS